ncbi:DUF4360 domain-containing protein [Actinoplanes hulinensis]|uniref:DUF4360 domain-containing protein n=1 Tax=Actinoplanes hulinensis TaxID=1144547 RepID=A0ABS7AUC4_9ACTN|nr:DUF4360 domain-containing protein [Actinoplanes hulinensis]MBW6432389.1 DUF4360 domain-containing protein [Actinoplanes hulinensis]
MFRLGRMMAAAVAGVSLIVPLMPSTALALARLVDPAVTLEVKAVKGSGCLHDSSVTTDVPDKTAFSVSFSQFKATGPGFKNCNVQIKVGIPAGWTYSVYEAFNRGYAVLDRGASGRIMMNSWFTGFPWTLRADQTFKGPYDDFWQTDSAANSLIFAPCGASANLILNTTLRVAGPETSSMELFAQDVRVSTKFLLKWKEC